MMQHHDIKNGKVGEATTKHFQEYTVCWSVRMKGLWILGSLISDKMSLNLVYFISYLTR